MCNERESKPKNNMSTENEENYHIILSVIIEHMVMMDSLLMESVRAQNAMGKLIIKRMSGLPAAQKQLIIDRISRSESSTEKLEASIKEIADTLQRRK